MGLFVASVWRNWGSARASPVKSASISSRTSIPLTSAPAAVIRRLYRLMVAERNGWQIVQEFVDKGISGAKGREQRPAFDALWKGAIRREFDVVMVWAVDRLGRSLSHLVNFLSEIHAKNVDLFIHQQGIDTTTPAGKALFGVMGVFAEFERSMIQERVRSGIKRVRATGQRWGRLSIEETDPATCTKILDLRRQSLGMAAIGKQVGVSSRTVWRFLRGVAAKSKGGVT